MPGAHLRYGMEAVPYELPYCVRFYVIFYLWVKGSFPKEVANASAFDGGFRRLFGRAILSRRLRRCQLLWKRSLMRLSDFPWKLYIHKEGNDKTPEICAIPLLGGVARGTSDGVVFLLFVVVLSSRLWSRTPALQFVHIPVRRVLSRRA